MIVNCSGWLGRRALYDYTTEAGLIGMAFCAINEAYVTVVCFTRVGILRDETTGKVGIADQRPGRRRPAHDPHEAYPPARSVALAGYPAGLRCFAIDDEAIDLRSFWQILHPAVNLRGDAFMHHQVTDLDVVRIERPTQNRRHLETQTLPFAGL